MTTVYCYCDRGDLELDTPCIATVMEMVKVIIKINITERLDSSAYAAKTNYYPILFEEVWEQSRRDVVTQMLDEIESFEFAAPDILLYVSYGVFRHLPFILDQVIPPRPDKSVERSR
jgi:hypothetical protein